MVTGGDPVCSHKYTFVSLSISIHSIFFTVNKSSIVKHMISIHLFAEIIISKYFLFIDAGIIGVGGAVSPSGDVFQEVPRCCLLACPCQHQ